MKPYTRADAETELTAALDSGHLSTAMAVAVELDAMPSPPFPRVPDAALWYATHGLAVFPLQPGLKVPYPHTRGVKDASTDLDEVARLFADRPGANLGLATGVLVDVIDFDGPLAHAAWGVAYGADWADAEVQVLGVVSTPRAGGLHVFVPATGAGNRAGYVGPHVDYRGLGGYVVAPPSSTSLGVYRWLRPLAVEELTA